MILYPKLVQYIEQFDFASISAERQELLSKMAADLTHIRAQQAQLKLMFVCTHNSRRSHIAQLWAAALADYYGMDEVYTFSAGTEATAFNPRAVTAMRNAGFLVESDGTTENPRYEINFSEGRSALIGFSKTIADDTNPKEGFIALMTCSEADSDCPLVSGSIRRFSLHYFDPKEADDTVEETARYAERCRQIGTELSYLLSLITNSNA